MQFPNNKDQYQCCRPSAARVCMKNSTTWNFYFVHSYFAAHASKNNFLHFSLLLFIALELITINLMFMLFVCSRFHQGMNSSYGNHYGATSQGYDQGVGGPPVFPRERYPGPSNFNDWRRDSGKDRGPDYRNRDYDRRPPAPNTQSRQ